MNLVQKQKPLAMSFSNIQLQNEEEEESAKKKCYSFFEDSPLKNTVAGAPNVLAENYLESRKAEIANKLEALRKATASVHLNKNRRPKEQTEESDEHTFPAQESRQKRGGNKLRKRAVADCLKAYCEPVGKQAYTKPSSQVKKSAHGFLHQFVNSKVNSDLMESIKSDLNKTKKYFVSKSDNNESQLYSKYFSTIKCHKPKTTTSCDRFNGDTYHSNQSELSEDSSGEQESEMSGKEEEFVEDSKKS